MIDHTSTRPLSCKVLHPRPPPLGARLPETLVESVKSLRASYESRKHENARRERALEVDYMLPPFRPPPSVYLAQCCFFVIPQNPCTMASTDRDVLLVLYRSTGGDTWKKKGKWNTDADLSQWQGVLVNGEGRVVRLDLRRNNLEGTVIDLPPGHRVLLPCDIFDLSQEVVDRKCDPFS